MTSYYAVANGRQIGIFHDWQLCKQSINGYKNAIFKKCKTMEHAELFINQYSSKTGIDLRNSTQSQPFDKPEPESEGSDSSDKSDLSDHSDNMIFEPDYYVYTDGACSNNGSHDAKAGIGIFFSVDDARNVSLRLESGKQTNNVAELTALIHTYKIIEPDVVLGKRIVIVSDSLYAIRCATTYGEKCAKKNWIQDIPNQELVKEVYYLYKDVSNVSFLHVNAHTTKDDIHSVGNYHADKLANLAIGMEECPYLQSKK